MVFSHYSLDLALSLWGKQEKKYEASNFWGVTMILWIGMKKIQEILKSCLPQFSVVFWFCHIPYSQCVFWFLRYTFLLLTLFLIPGIIMMVAYGLISLELYRGIKFDTSQRKSSRGNNTFRFGVGFLKLQLKIRAVILRLVKRKLSTCKSDHYGQLCHELASLHFLITVTLLLANKPHLWLVCEDWGQNTLNF